MRARLSGETGALGRRGVNRCARRSPSTGFTRLSIQPKHSASSTASLSAMPRVPDSLAMVDEPDPLLAAVVPPQPRPPRLGGGDLEGLADVHGLRGRDAPVRLSLTEVGPRGPYFGPKNPMGTPPGASTIAIQRFPPGISSGGNIPFAPALTARAYAALTSGTSQ